MKAGDLVQIIEKHSPSYNINGKKSGVVVEIDPLRKGRDPDEHEKTLVEIVVMLPCGKMWHARPTDWEVIDDL